MKIQSVVILCLSICVAQTKADSKADNDVFRAIAELDQSLSTGKPGHVMDDTKKVIEAAITKLQKAVDAAGTDFQKHSPGTYNHALNDLAEARTRLGGYCEDDDDLRAPSVRVKDKLLEDPKYEGNDPQLYERAFKCAGRLDELTTWLDLDHHSEYLKSQFDGTGKQHDVWQVTGKKGNVAGTYYFTQNGVAFLSDEGSSYCHMADQGCGPMVAVTIDNSIFSAAPPTLSGQFFRDCRSDPIAVKTPRGCSLKTTKVMDADAKAAMNAAILDSVKSVQKGFQRAENNCQRNFPNRDNFLRGLWFCGGIGDAKINDAIKDEVAKLTSPEAVVHKSAPSK